jgi:hypothetical protein
MTETYYKAVRPDGTDFWTGTVRWLPRTPLKRSRIVRHPSSTCAVKGDHSTSLAVSTDPTVLPGAGWPMRLCRVELVEDAIITDSTKRQSVAWRVVEEVDPAIRFGPQGPHVGALVARAGVITADEAERLAAARDAARVAAWAAARVAAWDAARVAARVAAGAAARVAAGAAARVAAWAAARVAAGDAAGVAAGVAAGDAAGVAAWDAAGVAAWDAAWALVVRDLIGQHGLTQAHYDTLTRPWRTVIGPIHPDDPEVTA